jgi:beta-galactosidase
MYEHAALASPVRLLPGDDATHPRDVLLVNRQDVRDLRWLRAEWCVITDAVDGAGLDAPVPCELPAVAAGASARLEVPAELLARVAAEADQAAETWLSLRVYAAEESSRVPQGALVAEQQVPVHPERRDLLARAGAVAAPVDGAHGRLVDDDGLLVHPALATAPRLALWRAPTDNDRIGGMADRWQTLGLDRLERRLVAVDERDGSTVVTADVVTGAGLTVRHTQTLTPLDGGTVLVEEVAAVPAELDDLPRVGSVFEVAAGVPATQVRWFGGGPSESYPDRRAAAVVGRHASEVDALFTPYVRPQESGGRNGVRWFELGVQGSASLRVHLDAPRQVSLTRYRAHDLATATHADELVPRPEVVVHVDAAHRGLGTASCGPDTLPQYLVGPGEYRWSYVLR